MSMDIDYYRILEISHDSTESEIQRAYKRLSMKWHPQMNHSEDATARFEAISEAFDVLNDRRNRAIYDLYGVEGLKEGISDGCGGIKGGSYVYKHNSQQIFKNFFGTDNPFVEFEMKTMRLGDGGEYVPKARTDDTFGGDIDCTLEELYHGCVKHVETSVKIYNHDTSMMDDVLKSFDIVIKPGSHDKQELRYGGMGGQLDHATPGDLVFFIHSLKHDKYEREGDNLVAHLTISLCDALTDSAVEMELLDGRKICVGLPEIITPNYVKVIPGEGMRKAEHPDDKGDLIMKFKVQFPKYLKPEVKSQLRKLLG